MKIILDVTRLVRRSIKGRKFTGIDRVTIAYVQHYKHNARALVRWCGRSWILSDTQSKILFTRLFTLNSAFALQSIIIKGLLKTVNQCLSESILINTGHIGLGQTDYLRLSRKHGLKIVFVVHDLIPIYYPEYCDEGESTRHREKMNYLLSMASGVITNSKSTLFELEHYAQHTKQSLPRAQVALLAPGIEVQPPKARPINRPYFVILSTIEPRKNHLLLLQVWRKLVQTLGKTTPHLFVIGKRGWECENVFDMLDRCECLKDVVTEVSLCSDADLSTYIYYSQALLFPSFVEGYGLPLVEALALGTPVIASNLPVFREIAGDIPEYVDPLDGKQWEKLIIEYTKPNSDQRALQIKNISHFRTPTWREHFDKVDLFLEEGFTNH